MWPAVGWSKPAIRRRQVVFPEPEGPSIAKNSPATMSRSTPSTALTAPKWRLTSRNSTAVEEVDAMSPLGSEWSIAGMSGGEPASRALSVLCLSAADHGDVIGDPAIVWHAGRLRRAFGDRRLPELDAAEIVVAVGLASVVGQERVALHAAGTAGSEPNQAATSPWTFGCRECS